MKFLGRNLEILAAREAGVSIEDLARRHRLATRTESGLYSAWTFGASVPDRNVAKLTQATTCTSSACTTGIAVRSFRYDNLGRPASNVLTTGGNSYQYSSSYNPQNGRLARLRYPSGLVLNHVYNQYGFLCRLAEFNFDAPTCSYAASGTKVFWTANNRDAELHLTQSTAGNGIVTDQAFDPDTGLVASQRAGPVVGDTWGSPNTWGHFNWGGPTVADFAYNFDTIGNLFSRTDSIGGYIERYCFDALNRLTNSATGAAGVVACTSSGAGITTKSVSYPSQKRNSRILWPLM